MNEGELICKIGEQIIKGLYLRDEEDSEEEVIFILLIKTVIGSISKVAGNIELSKKEVTEIEEKLFLFSRQQYIERWLAQVENIEDEEEERRMLDIILLICIIMKNIRMMISG